MCELAIISLKSNAASDLTIKVKILSAGSSFAMGSYSTYISFTFSFKTTCLMLEHSNKNLPK